MTGNRELIERHLGNLGLPTRRKEEILRELGDHVEDHAAALEARGVPRDAAAREALDSVSDWLNLRQEILRAETEEGNMNYRTKAFWLPAMCALAISSGLLAVFQHAGLAPRFYWLSGEPGTYHAFFAFYVPWLIALPVVGAVAAFWSQLAGGKALHRMLAALAPSLGMLGFFLIGPLIAVPVRMVIAVHYHKPISFFLTGFSLIQFITGFLVLFDNWVLLPAIPLFLGAAPFLRKPHAQSS